MKSAYEKEINIVSKSAISLALTDSFHFSRSDLVKWNRNPWRFPMNIRKSTANRLPGKRNHILCKRVEDSITAGIYKCLNKFYRRNHFIITDLWPPLYPLESAFHEFWTTQNYSKVPKMKIVHEKKKKRLAYALQ